MWFFFVCQFKLILCNNFLSIFTSVKILIHSPAEDLSNKKNRSFLRLLWAEIFPRQFTKFWHKRAILCAPTVCITIHKVPDKRAYKRRRGFEGKGRVSPRSTRAQAPRPPPIQTTGASFSTAFSASQPCEKPTNQAPFLSSSLFPSDALQRFFYRK